MKALPVTSAPIWPHCARTSRTSAETMSELVQHRTKAVGVRASSAFEEVRDKIASTAADARSQVRAAGNDIEASFERHPLAALLIAFGIGIALGMMSRGHR